MIPESIGRYEVQCLLGEGAFGQVFAARDPVLGRGVAIKLLRSMYGNDASFMARFRGEAASLAALAHPNITAIHDILEDEAQHGMVMELVHGHTLDHVLRQVRRLPLRECLAVTAQTAAGLTYIHRLGVVHRDIKPSNIMLTADGVLKIMDFGIARIQGSTRLTHDGSAVGTLAYAAPEQIKRDEGTPASDQYSLACMIYEMLSGDPPFEATTEFELMQAQIAAMPKPVSARVPGMEQIDQVLLRALAKAPADRFGSVQDFADALGVLPVQPDAGQVLRELMARTGAVPPIPARRAALVARSSRPKPDQPAAEAAGSLRANTPFLAMGAALGIAIAVGTFVMLDYRAVHPPATAYSTEAPKDTQVAFLAEPAPPAAPAPPASSAAPAPPASSVAPAPPAGPSPPAAPVPPTVASAPSVAPADAVSQSAQPKDNSAPHLEAEARRPVITPLPAPAMPSATVSPPTQAPARRASPEAAAPRGGRAGDEMAERPTLELAPNTRNEPSAEQIESYVAISADPILANPAQKPAQRMPKGVPTYQGRVEDWIGGNLLFVQSPTGGVKKMDLSLFGIVGKKGTPREAAEARTRLESFAKGRIIKCWLRQEDNSQQKNMCFLGDTDIALWALEQKLVEPSKNAPAEYLAVRQ